MNVRKKPSALEVVTLARPPLPLASGDDVAGSYKIIEHYGSGPLGHAYRARAPDGLVVAVKVIAREMVPTPGERQFVVGELEKLIGKTMARVAVPIAASLDENAAWVVSRWVRGRSLRRTLGAYRDAAQPVTYAEALGILEGVALALRELHALCPHGALYPESVQIGRDGKVVLTDPGIAASVPRARLIEHFERFPDVVAYLSPEIRGGKRPSAASDLYALGALASELLTGDPGAGAAGIAGAMMQGLPPEIDKALQGLAALKANERASALPLLLGALARAVGERAMPATASLPKRRAPTDVMPAAPEEPIRGARTRRDTPR